MKLISRIQETIDWNKTVEEQSDKLAQFNDISENEIRELAQCIKSTEAGILIEYLGYKKLKNHLPLFLEFLQDINWPAARGAIKMLLEAGEALIPEIQRVINEVDNDQIWHYWILLGIVQHWQPEMVAKIKPELLELVKRADKEGASIVALRILKDNSLITNSELTSHYQYLLAKFAGEQVWIDELNDELGEW